MSDCSPVHFLFGMLAAVALMLFYGLTLFAFMALCWPRAFGFKRRWSWQSTSADPFVSKAKP